MPDRLSTPRDRRQPLLDLRRRRPHRLADRLAVAYGDTGRVQIHDVASGKPLCEFQTPDGKNIMSLEFSRDGKHVFTQCVEGTAQLWDAGESLGRVVNSRKVQTAVLVIDRADKIPTEN